MDNEKITYIESVGFLPLNRYFEALKEGPKKVIEEVQKFRKESKTKNTPNYKRSGGQPDNPTPLTVVLGNRPDTQPVTTRHFGPNMRHR